MFHAGTGHEFTYVVGICGGLLPGAAAATAKNMNELLCVGWKLLHVAFNLGVAQWRRGIQIEGKPGRWAVAIVNILPKHVRNIITAFNEEMVSSVTYILWTHLTPRLLSSRFQNIASFISAFSPKAGLLFLGHHLCSPNYGTTLQL